MCLHLDTQWYDCVPSHTPVQPTRTSWIRRWGSLGGSGHWTQKQDEYRVVEAITRNVDNVGDWNCVRLSGTTLCEMQIVNTKRTNGFMWYANTSLRHLI